MPLWRFRPAAPHLVRTVPWAVLIAACATGLAISLVSSQFLNPLRSTGGVLLVSHLSAVPLAAAIAFLAWLPDRSLTATLPAPCWLSHAFRVACALPVIGLTAFIQYELARRELAVGSAAAQPGRVSWPTQLAEFCAWLAVATAAAAAVDRTRWRELGGAVAAPITLALIGLLVAVPSYSAGDWWATALAAGLVAAGESRDPWRRVHGKIFRRAAMRSTVADADKSLKHGREAIIKIRNIS